MIVMEFQVDPEFLGLIFPLRQDELVRLESCREAFR